MKAGVNDHHHMLHKVCASNLHVSWASRETSKNDAPEEADEAQQSCQHLKESIDWDVGRDLATSTVLSAALC